MLKKVINQLAANPKIFILLRRILENNFKAQKKVIKNYFAEEDREQILDIGCGTGEFSVFFKPGNYTGIDIETAYIDYAKKHYQGKFLIDDATKMFFTNQAFGRAIIQGVLHHLDDQVCAEIFKQMKRVLKLGARILIMEDVISAGDGWLTKKLHSLDKGKNIRTAEQYNNLLRPHFKIIESFKIQSGLCPYQVFLLKLGD